MGRSLEITIKRLAPWRELDGHVKEPTEMSMAFGARPYQSACILLVKYLCAVTCLTEISLNLNVTLRNQPQINLIITLLTKRPNVGVGMVEWIVLACSARGPVFESTPHHLNFRDLVSPGLKSRYD